MSSYTLKLELNLWMKGEKKEIPFSSNLNCEENIMQTQIRWNTKELTKDLPEDESGFYKAIGELLPEIEIPNKLYISCHMGDAEFLLKQRGTYTKNGEVKPSLYVTEEYNNIYGLTPSTYSDAYLTCINPESNNYKYYWLHYSYLQYGCRIQRKKYLLHILENYRGRVHLRAYLQIQFLLNSV